MSDENKIRPEDEVAVPPAPPAFDTTNRFLVSAQGDKVMVMTVYGMRPFTKLEILSLVAWATVMADLTVEQIEEAVAAVRSC